MPFHLLRSDIAGNISKRFSLSGIHIPRHGGACPRWNVYTAFMQPGTINVQISQMPDGETFFCIARTVLKASGGYGQPRSYLSIGLGCAMSDASELVYADGIDLDQPERIVPIGVSCRTCPRMDCGQRAFPPVAHALGNRRECPRRLGLCLCAHAIEKGRVRDPPSYSLISTSSCPGLDPGISTQTETR